MQNMRGSMFNSNEKPAGIYGVLIAGWRKLAFVLALYVLISYFIHVYYDTIYNSLFNLFIVIGLFIFLQYKVSIDPENVQISHPDCAFY